jgi:hypothetical protein
MENTTKKIRVTKAQRFEDIKALLLNVETSYETDIATAVDFLNKEITMLANKNKSSTKKPTAVQTMNVGLKENIIAYMTNHPEFNPTCSELIKTIPELNDYSTSKVSALMGQLIKEGKVTKGYVKGSAKFSIA